MPPAPASPSPEIIARIQRGFEAALPKLNDVIHFRLHGLPDQLRDELSDEARAIAWGNYRQICLKGRDPEPLLHRIADFAALHAYRGGHLAGQERINDALSRSARVKRGVVVQSIDDEARPGSVRDHRESSPADEAIARVDHTEFLARLTPTQREIADDLAAGQTTADVGRKRGVSRTRIWQHREEMKAALHDSVAR